MSILDKPFTAIAFDFGLKKIGVAVGQSITKTASPLTVIKAQNGKPNTTELEKILSTWRPQVIIVGLPLQEDGSNQELTDLSKLFAENLINQYKSKYKFELFFSDERHTSNEAKLKFKELRQNNLIKQGEHLDHIAASIILQRWFNSI